MYPCLDYEIKEHGLSLFADMYSVAMEFFFKSSRTAFVIFSVIQETL